MRPKTIRTTVIGLPLITGMFTLTLACRAGAYAQSYRRSHSGIGAADYLIAGTSSALGTDLLTVNVRHFPMFNGLQAPYPDA